MPIILVEEEETYEESGTVFTYERLRSQDREQLRYLLSTRGMFEQEVYERAVIAVCLRGWSLLLGRGGREILWPALEVHPEPLGIQGNGTHAAAAMLFPHVSQARQRQLTILFEVVSRFGSDLHVKLYGKMNELEPEELKKSWETSSAENSASPTDAPDGSSLAATAATSAATTRSPSPATPEA